MYKVKTKKLNNNMTDITKRYRLIRDWEMPNRKIPAGSIYVKFTKTNRSYFNSQYNHFVTSTSIRNSGWFEEVVSWPDNNEKILSYNDVWHILNELNPLNINSDNKGYLHHLFYNKIVEIKSSLNLNTNDTGKEEIAGYAKVMWSEKDYLAVRYKGEAYEVQKQKPEQPTNDNAFVWDEDTAKEYGKFCVLNHSWLQWEDFKKQSKQSAPVDKPNISEIPLMKIDDYKNNPLSSFYKPKNKPVTDNSDVSILSVNDVVKLFPLSGNEAIKRLNELVKQKLNK